MEKKSYVELKEKLSNFKHEELFFAFGQKQFEEKIKEIPKGKKIFSAGSGIYGTQKAFECLENFTKEIEEEIKTKCSPQEVYNYEFCNYECGYIQDDSEAWEVVLRYWENPEVKRNFAI